MHVTQFPLKSAAVAAVLTVVLGVFAALAMPLDLNGMD